MPVSRVTWRGCGTTCAGCSGGACGRVAQAPSRRVEARTRRRMAERCPHGAPVARLRLRRCAASARLSSQPGDSMTDRHLDVLAIGNAIVDVIADADDDFLAREGMHKGAMRLIDEGEAVRLYEAMGPGREASGGSAANTAAGIASLGLKAGFIGQLANDQLGAIFGHDIRSLGVEFDTAPRDDVGATARCLILVTPDAQRTMNTFLGAAQRLGPEAVDPAHVAEAQILYLEGYLWDPDEPRQA